jgi:hypothetical protein
MQPQDSTNPPSGPPTGPHPGAAPFPNGPAPQSPNPFPQGSDTNPGAAPSTFGQPVGAPDINPGPIGGPASPAPVSPITSPAQQPGFPGSQPVGNPQPTFPGQQPAGPFNGGPGVPSSAPTGQNGPFGATSGTPTGPPNDTFSPGGPSSSKKKRLLIAGAIVLAALAAAIALTMVTMSMLASIKLTGYSTAKYSLQVPAEYKKTVSGDSVTFKEDEKKSTQSQVMVYYSDFPTTLSDDQVRTIRETLRTQLTSAAESLTEEDDQEVKDLKVNSVKYHSADALELTASVAEKGKTAGDIRVIAVVNSKQLYMVGVAAHNGDKGLQKKTDSIIDSFKLK